MGEWSIADRRMAEAARKEEWQYSSAHAAIAIMTVHQVSLSCESRKLPFFSARMFVFMILEQFKLNAVPLCSIREKPIISAWC